MQLRDGEPKSSATLQGMEDDWNHEYVLGKFVIFYSQNNHYGSMHAIRGLTFPFEIQFVHYRKDFSSMEEAAHVRHGILVLCILFEVTLCDTSSESTFYPIFFCKSRKFKKKLIPGHKQGSPIYAPYSVCCRNGFVCIGQT